MRYTAYMVIAIRLAIGYTIYRVFALSGFEPEKNGEGSRWQNGEQEKTLSDEPGTGQSKGDIPPEYPNREEAAARWILRHNGDVRSVREILHPTGGRR